MVKITGEKRKMVRYDNPLNNVDDIVPRLQPNCLEDDGSDINGLKSFRTGPLAQGYTGNYQTVLTAEG